MTALCFGLVAALSFHGTFIYLTFFTNDYPFLWHMIVMLCYELAFMGAAAAIALVYLICKLIAATIKSIR